MPLSSSADFFFFKINLFKNLFRENYHSVKRFGLNCLQKLLSGNKFAASKERV